MKKKINMTIFFFGVKDPVPIFTGWPTRPDPTGSATLVLWESNEPKIENFLNFYTYYAG